MSAIDIFRFAEGTIIERWGEANVVGLRQRIGKMPNQDGT